MAINLHDQLVIFISHIVFLVTFRWHLLYFWLIILNLWRQICNCSHRCVECSSMVTTSRNKCLMDQGMMFIVWDSGVQSLKTQMSWKNLTEITKNQAKPMCFGNPHGIHSTTFCEYKPMLAHHTEDPGAYSISVNCTKHLSDLHHHLGHWLLAILACDKGI